MRLLTYNIHGCADLFGRRQPDAVIEVIRDADADVVALQEVYDESQADHGFLRRLVKDLGYPFQIHGPTMRKAEADYGNLLLLREEPLEQRLIDITQVGNEPRGAIFVKLRHGDWSVELIATHLGLRPAERRAQIEQLVAVIGPTRAPEAIRVLMGDLNEWWPYGGAQKLLNRHFGSAQPLRSFPAPCPLLALDRIHVASGTVPVIRRTIRTRMARRASDHLPLLAELDLG